MLVAKINFIHHITEVLIIDMDELSVVKLFSRNVKFMSHLPQYIYLHTYLYIYLIILCFANMNVQRQQMSVGSYGMVTPPKL